MAEINYLFGVIKAGKVIKRYFGHSLSIIGAIRKKFPGCEVEAYDVSEYGMKFKDTPCIIAEGNYFYKVQCKETGKIWANAKECAKAIGVPVKTLYTAISRGSGLQGFHYLKLTNKET